MDHGLRIAVAFHAGLDMQDVARIDSAQLHGSEIVDEPFDKLRVPDKRGLPDSAAHFAPRCKLGCELGERDAFRIESQPAFQLPPQFFACVERICFRTMHGARLLPVFPGLGVFAHSKPDAPGAGPPSLDGAYTAYFHACLLCFRKQDIVCNMAGSCVGGLGFGRDAFASRRRCFHYGKQRRPFAGFTKARGQFLGGRASVGPRRFRYTGLV